MKYIVFFIVCLLFWFLLTLNFTAVYLIVGAIIALLTTIIFGKYFLSEWKKFFNPLRYFWLLVYIPIFLWECIKANIDVAYRVLHPKLPIKPGIVKVKTNLKSDIGKVFLANSITMTPGTLSVDLVDDILYIHWINVKTTDPKKYTQIIAGRFEKYLKRIFE